MEKEKPSQLIKETKLPDSPPKPIMYGPTNSQKTSPDRISIALNRCFRFICATLRLVRVLIEFPLEVKRLNSILSNLSLGFGVKFYLFFNYETSGACCLGIDRLCRWRGACLEHAACGLRKGRRRLNTPQGA
jgi:hypothetical protein